MYRGLVILTSALLGFTIFQPLPWQSPQVPTLSAEPAISFRRREIEPPHAKEVEQLLQRLRYTGIPMLLRDEVSLGLDFDRGLWWLRSLHRFDGAGNLILEEWNGVPDGKSGTCGELGEYTSHAIRDLFGPDYQVRFVKCAQAGFFLSPEASHIVLEVQERARPGNLAATTYLVDPSFRRYGPVSEFEDYYFFEGVERLPFAERRETDVSAPVHTYIPLLIEGEFLLSLGVEKCNGKFDSGNFAISLALTRKHRYAGRYVLVLRRSEGKTDILEDRYLADRVLERDEYERVRRKLVSIFEKIIGEGSRS